MDRTSPANHEVVPLRAPMHQAAVQGTLALDLQPRQDPPPARIMHLDPQRRGMDAWVSRFAQAVVEIVGGDRPASQLVRWTDRDVYLDLRRRAVLVGRAGAHTPGVSRVQTTCPRVESVRSVFVAHDVVESCIRVRYGQRSRAIAARFERRDHGWLCTALEFA